MINAKVGRALPLLPFLMLIAVFSPLERSDVRTSDEEDLPRD